MLGADGVGRTSDVIAGIQWAVANRARYNIRVINLSLGHPVTEPSATDPLCEAVADAVHAGIVVVAAAGNDGLAADGSRVLGGINSPGNSPWAITVGSLNTLGHGAARRRHGGDLQLARTDARTTSRSSRTSRRPATRSSRSRRTARTSRPTYSYLHRAGSGTNAYMQLSGTSMAAPMVSGGVALLLQGTPGMTPAQVKMALQAGATYMPDAGLMGAGAGSVNFMASRKIAIEPARAAADGLIGGLLGAGRAARSSGTRGTLASRLYAGTGIRLLSLSAGTAGVARTRRCSTPAT